MFDVGYGFCFGRAAGGVRLDGMDMDPRIAIDLLVELGRHEEELAELRASKARARRQARDQRALADEYDDDAEAAADAGREADRDFRRYDREMRAVEAMLETKKDRRVGLTDRRQHWALGEEIAALQRKLEDLELAALAALEAGDAGEKEAGEARREAERVSARMPAPDPEADRRTEAATLELEQEIERLVGMLPPDIGRHVARLRQRGDRAVAWVDEGGVCTGCFGQLPAQQGIAANKGRVLVRCTTCSRYVVHRPWR